MPSHALLLSEALAHDHDSLIQAYQFVASASSDSDTLPARDVFMIRTACCIIREKLVLLPVIQQRLLNGSERHERYRLDYLSVRGSYPLA